MSEHTPGGPIPEYMLYNAKMGADGKITGFEGPDGNSYRFENSEQLVQFERHEGEGRKTYVETQDGVLTPVEKWIAERK